MRQSTAQLDNSQQTTHVVAVGFKAHHSKASICLQLTLTSSMLWYTTASSITVCLLSPFHTHFISNFNYFAAFTLVFVCSPEVSTLRLSLTLDTHTQTSVRSFYFYSLKLCFPPPPAASPHDMPLAAAGLASSNACISSCKCCCCIVVLPA